MIDKSIRKQITAFHSCYLPNEGVLIHNENRTNPNYANGWNNEIRRIVGDKWISKDQHMSV